MRNQGKQLIESLRAEATRLAAMKPCKGRQELRARKGGVEQVMRMLRRHLIFAKRIPKGWPDGRVKDYYGAMADLVVALPWDNATLIAAEVLDRIERTMKRRRMEISAS